MVNPVTIDMDNTSHQVSTSIFSDVSRHMDQVQHYTASFRNERIYVVWGKGGFVSAGVYLSWEGRCQAKSVCNGVNYFHAIGCHTTNDCFEHMPKDYHGVETHEKACVLNMQARPDMTNLDIDLAPASLIAHPK